MNIKKPNAFKSAETATATITLSEPLDDKRLKVGIYDSSGKSVFETEYPGGQIQKIDRTHYVLKLTSEMTKKFEGILTMRFAIYTRDMQLVVAGDSCLTLKYEYDPVIANLK